MPCLLCPPPPPPPPTHTLTPTHTRQVRALSNLSMHLHKVCIHPYLMLDDGGAMHGMTSGADPEELVRVCPRGVATSPACLAACLLAFMPTCLAAYLPASRPASLPAGLPA